MVPTAKFTTWLYRIVHNRIIDYYHRSGKGIPISYDDENLSEEQLLNLDNRNIPDQIAQSDQETERLLAAIANCGLMVVIINYLGYALDSGDPYIL